MKPVVGLALLLLVAVLGLGFASSADAARPGQLSFDSGARGARLILSYQIRDVRGRVGKLQLPMSRSALEGSRERFRGYDLVELRAEADDYRLERTRVAVGELRERFPDIEIQVMSDGSISWRTRAPTDFVAGQHAAFDNTLAAGIAAIERRIPGSSIRLSANDTYSIRAGNDADLARVQRAMERAQEAAQRASAEYAQGVNRRIGARSSKLDERIEVELERIQQEMQGFHDGYLSERLFVRGAGNLIRPDYRRIAELESPPLSSAARALLFWTRVSEGAASRRVVLNRLLLFTQTIPYDSLPDRARTIGFLPPLQLLAENRGDCDSKAVLFAALAHRLYPDLGMVLVLLPEHAYLALDMRPQSGETGLRYEGRPWVAAEPVGPAVEPLGRLGPESRGRVAESVLRLF